MTLRPLRIAPSALSAWKKCICCFAQRNVFFTQREYNAEILERVRKNGSASSAYNSLCAVLRGRNVFIVSLRETYFLRSVRGEKYNAEILERIWKNDSALSA
jgi:hypothetical protein